MKKYIAFALALLMFMSFATSVLAAGTPANHVHNWIKQEGGYPPTCTEPGYYGYYCPGCGRDKAEYVPPLGHDWTTKVYQSYADCTHYGVFYWVCSRCGAHSATGNDKPLGHDWGEWKVVKYLTTEENGLMERECQRCGITEQMPITMDELPGGSGLKLEAWVVLDTEYAIGQQGNFAVKFINSSDTTMLLTGFVIGGFRFNALIRNKRIYIAGFFRLIVIPLLLAGILKLLGISGSILICALTAYCMPMGLNTVIIPASYNGDTSLGAGLALISNVLSIITIPLMFLIFA